MGLWNIALLGYFRIFSSRYSVEREEKEKDIKIVQSKVSSGYAPRNLILNK
jgi:hypothetical protein